MAISQCSENSNNVRAKNLIRDLIPYKINNVFILSNEELLNLYRQPNTPEYIRNELQHEVVSHRLYLAETIGLNIFNFHGQEALFSVRQKTLSEYKKITQNPKWKTCFPESHQKAKEIFNKKFEKIQNFLTKNPSFTTQTASQGLQILTDNKGYIAVTRNDDETQTTGMQMFVSLINICEQKFNDLINEHMWLCFQEEFSKPKLWNLFKSEAENYFGTQHIELKGNLADTVNNDREKNFKEALEYYNGNPNMLSCFKGIYHRLYKKYYEFFKDAYSNVVEVLFMMQRGHNTNLDSPQEENHPRCPAGFWDDCIYEISNATGFIPL